MRTFVEIIDNMRAEHTFSNMSEFDHWAVRWCERCAHVGGCPIMNAAVVMEDSAPAEWEKISGPEGPFRCTEFKPST